MEHSERRRATRFVYPMSVRLRSREGDAGARVYSVSRHGLFVITANPQRAGELVQLHISLPAQGGQARGSVRMIAAVAWALSPGEARLRRRDAGMGLHMYMLNAKDKALWDELIDELEAQEGVPCSREPAVRPQETVEPSRPRYLMRARNLEGLTRFAERDIERGGIFLHTPLVGQLDEQVDLILIHPHTDGEFVLPAQIYAVRGHGPVAQRGMDIHFIEPEAALRARFMVFVESGLANAA